MAKFVDDMRAMGVINAYQISRRYECPVIYYNTQHPHALGWNDYRAEVKFLRDGKWWNKTLKCTGGTAKARRDAHLQLAVEWATEHLGIKEWVPTGFPNTWMPKDVHARMKAELKAWRKEQSAAAVNEGT